VRNKFCPEFRTRGCEPLFVGVKRAMLQPSCGEMTAMQCMMTAQERRSSATAPERLSKAAFENLG
jgi:hypothetical protein